MKTPGDHEFQHLWMDVQERQEVIFKVRACAEANIILSEFPTISDYRTYEFSIGFEENTKAYVRKSVSGDPVKTVDLGESYGLSCEYEVPYWIQWRNMINDTLRLQMGAGSVAGENVFVNWTDTDDPYQVQAVGYATSNAYEGTWLFTEAEGIDNYIR